MIFIKAEIVNTTHIERKWIDVPYANVSESQKLDIYLPNNIQVEQLPVIVSIHGGAFAFGDKQDTQLIPMLEGINRGYAVVSINYRLSGEAHFPAQIHDVKAAIRFLKANAEIYSLNPNKIAVWGGSAGGNLSALIGTSFNNRELEDLKLGNSKYDCGVQAVVDWFGPTDFIKMDEQLKESELVPQDHSDEDSPESRLMGKKITEIPNEVKLANPATYVSKDAPPFLIQHGDIDNLVPYQQSVLLKDRLLEVVDEKYVEFEIIKGARHGGDKFKTTENISKVFNFLDKYLK